MPHTHEETPASEPALSTKKSYTDMAQAPDDCAVQNRQGRSPRFSITRFLLVTVLVLPIVAAFIITASCAALLISSSFGSNQLGRQHLSGAGLVKRTELKTGQLVGIIIGALVLVLIVCVLLWGFNQGMRTAIQPRRSRN